MYNIHEKNDDIDIGDIWKIVHGADWLPVRGYPTKARLRQNAQLSITWVSSRQGRCLQISWRFAPRDQTILKDSN